MLFNTFQVGIRSITAEGRAQAKVKYHKETSIDSTISYLGFKIKDKVGVLLGFDFI